MERPSHVEDHSSNDHEPLMTTEQAIADVLSATESQIMFTRIKAGMVTDKIFTLRGLVVPELLTDLSMHSSHSPVPHPILSVHERHDPLNPAGPAQPGQGALEADTPVTGSRATSPLARMMARLACPQADLEGRLEPEDQQQVFRQVLVRKPPNLHVQKALEALAQREADEAARVMQVAAKEAAVVAAAASAERRAARLATRKAGGTASSDSEEEDKLRGSTVQSDSQVTPAVDEPSVVVAWGQVLGQVMRPTEKPAQPECSPRLLARQSIRPRTSANALTLGLLVDSKHQKEGLESESSEYAHQLSALQHTSAECVSPGRGTFTGLVKPSHNSAVNAVQLAVQDGWDSHITLNWSSRGIGLRKMQALQDTLIANSSLSALQLSGNALDNVCVHQLLAILCRDDAPTITQLDLSTNTSVTWHVAGALALALGAPPGDDVELLQLATLIRPLKLRRLVLSGIKLGDKGGAELGRALRVNRTLRVLDVSRCGISEQGGAFLFDALHANRTLLSLDASWNAIRGLAAVTLQSALGNNCGLQRLLLAHNGFTDLDAGRILRGLQNHGHWRHVDLSFNNCGAGAALVLGQLSELFAEVAARGLAQGAYQLHWPASVQPGEVSTLGWWSDPTAAPGVGHASRGATPLGETLLRPPESGKASQPGRQLAQGPVLVEFKGNPLGLAGTREVLHAMDAMSKCLAASQTGQASSGRGEPDEDNTPAWPFYTTLDACNVTLADGLPEDCKATLEDPYSPNPFLKSLFSIVDDQAGKGGKVTASPKKRPASPSKGKDKSGTAKGKEKGVASPKPKSDLTFNTSSQNLDLESPAGKYVLDLAHPGSIVLITDINRLAQQVKAAAGVGQVESSVAVLLKEAVLNGRPVAVARLLELAESAQQGMLSFTVAAPSVLVIGQPEPMSDAVCRWLVNSMEKSADLFKLGVIEVACSRFYFTATQAYVLLQMFNPEMSGSEQIRAAEMLYLRTLNPIDFWEQTLPMLAPLQSHSLRQQLTAADLGALDILRPCGHYHLNLSRAIDRHTAIRLQEAACLARPWMACKHHIPWRNASLAGRPLSLTGLGKLREWTMPEQMTLKLDYVSYEVPSPQEEPCDMEELQGLFIELRSAHRVFRATMLRLVDEYLPNGQTRAGLHAHQLTQQAHARFRARPASGKELGQGPHIAKFMLSKLKEAAQDLAAATSPHVPATPMTTSQLRVSGSTGVDAESEVKAPPTWWSEVGFNAQPLLKRLAEKYAAAAATAAAQAAPAGSRSGTPAPGIRSPEPPEPKESKGKGKDKDKPAKIKSTAKALSGPLLSPEAEAAAAQAAVLAGRLLAIPSIRDVATLLSRFGTRHLARVLCVLIEADASKGAAAAARLLDALDPVSACVFTHDMLDSTVAPTLLPLPARQAILQELSPGSVQHLGVVAEKVNVAAAARGRVVRQALSLFCAKHALSAGQAECVLRFCRWSVDRSSALIIMWGRVVDRSGLFNLWRTLSYEEQRQVLPRLGHWHVWTGLEGRSQDLHWHLDLTVVEQREVARDIVRIAVRAKEAAKKQGLPLAQLLLSLMGNGVTLTVPEDDKMWSMIESSYQTLEFTFAPTPAQVAQKEMTCIRYIQESWRYTAAMRHARGLADAQDQKAREAKECASKHPSTSRTTPCNPNP